MTGTGVQTDPYIPENWEEFVEAIENNGAYISCPENAVWDMNEIMPAGITSVITIRAKQVLGNNTTIKNLVFNCSKAFSANGSFEFIKLNFLNMYATINSESCFYTNSNNTYFRNCKFSGIITHGSFLDGGSSAGVTFINDTGENPKGCSFNLEFYGNGQMNTANSNTKFENCNIHISGKNDATLSSAFFKNCIMTNSYISGKCPTNNGMYITLRNNIYDIEISVGKVYSNTPTNLSKMSTVINDSIVNEYTQNNDIEDYLIKATEEQMHNVEYLKSQGFPIA